MMAYSDNLLLLLLLSLVGFTCFQTLAFGATFLPSDEVKALREIGNAISKTDWNFSADPCGGQWGWVILDPIKGTEGAVTCNCTFLNNTNTVCHVVSIVLRNQSLPGVLPKEIIRLPYLQEIDLSRNYLSGTIPPEWGTTQLTNISLLGNRLTGPIPKEIGNISTLLTLVLECNHLSGLLPAELGNLPNIQRLLISSNSFTGELPATFAKMTTLIEFHISDNLFTGKIPNLIQNWTNMERLVIQASGLDGPIPDGIAFLTKLTDLRISDLSRTEGAFPGLVDMNNLKTLILRSCNIIGPLPGYLGDMTKLKTLDLSFNKLIGTIPSSYSTLSKVDSMYFTGNLLTGAVPDWMLKKADNIDLSYNNFTTESTGGLSCQQNNVNLFASSSVGNNSGIVPCLRSFTCPQKWYSFHINCGGKEVTVEDTKFEEDIDRAGPARFFRSKTNWAFSSTGQFLDDDRSTDSFIWTNWDFPSTRTSELFMNARLSPLSLTYYGFCLENGNYTVNLQFVEIMLTGEKTYGSLGRRVFDVYIQGKLVLEDFNIAQNGSWLGVELTKKFNATVSSGTLEIRFQWAGKGTTSLPTRGVYGPLISAISVNSDFGPPSDFEPPSENKTSISVGMVAGIVVGVVVAIFLLVCILWWKCCRKKERMEHDLRGLDLHTGSFTLRQIKAATNNFDPSNKVGEGGFGSVYKGLLLDGTIIAVKQLSSTSKQGTREFVNEIGMISALQHPHLVKLYGCCIESNQLLLVYEYMENNSLARALFGPEETRINLDWKTRHRICIGIARGLAYLHEESRLKIVHRDIKATNVLLDNDLNAKISDFGLAKLNEENTHISTRIAGTYGYMAPEYAMRGYLTDKADVYSFGVVALEIVSGRSITSYNPEAASFYLLDWALQLKQKDSLMELVDLRLGSDYSKEEVMVMIKLALLCTNSSASVRPAMSSVVRMLEGKIPLADIPSYPNDPSNEMNNPTELRPWTDASSTGPDLYPFDFDSRHLLDRRDGQITV